MVTGSRAEARLPAACESSPEGLDVRALERLHCVRVDEPGRAAEDSAVRDEPRAEGEGAVSLNSRRTRDRGVDASKIAESDRESFVTVVDESVQARAIEALNKTIQAFLDGTIKYRGRRGRR